jgi:hypothetical protein
LAGLVVAELDHARLPAVAFAGAGHLHLQRQRVDTARFGAGGARIGVGTEQTRQSDTAQGYCDRGEDSVPNAHDQLRLTFNSLLQCTHNRLHLQSDKDGIGELIVRIAEQSPLFVIPTLVEDLE